MSLLGLVRHMAEVERNWFRRVLAGEDAPPAPTTTTTTTATSTTSTTPTSPRRSPTGASECENARTRRAAFASLDDVRAADKRSDQDVSVRWVLVHMIEEYARHNGHADLLRERIDGTTGD